MFTCHTGGRTRGSRRTLGCVRERGSKVVNLRRGGGLGAGGWGSGRRRGGPGSLRDVVTSRGRTEGRREDKEEGRERWRKKKKEESVGQKREKERMESSLRGKRKCQ